MDTETPILFCVFNRPEQTQRVFERSAQWRPRQLFVAADGPRKSSPQDHLLIERTRELATQVDWNCDLRVSFQDHNLGCRRAMNGAIDWAFEYVNELVILEDDCLPEFSFFKFCDELLDRYRHDERVMMVSGDNFQPCRRTPESYFFSKYGHIWGWATWRSAWRNLHDPAMQSWSESDCDWLKSNCPDPNEFEFWSEKFHQQVVGEIDTWDFAWQKSIWQNDGLVAMPNVNLVSNIGFGENATHTTMADSVLANLKTNSIQQITHPQSVEQCVLADQFTWETIFSPADCDREFDITLHSNSIWNRLWPWKQRRKAA